MRKFRKQIEKMDPPARRAIELKIAEIFRGDVEADIQKLTDFSYADFRLRIGDFRLLFHRDKKENKYYFTECHNRSNLY